MKNIRQMYENYGGQLVRNGLVMFRISCIIEERHKLVGLLGDHKIQLVGTDWNIKINCFVFCVVCKKEGHKISECTEKVVNCF